jgi:MFS family permease
MGYPLFNAFLPQYLQNLGKGLPPTPMNIVYRNYLITSCCGVPGSIIACKTVDLKYIGRKGTMALATLLTAIFVFLFTISPDPNYQLVFSCLTAFFQNIMYGVLYAYTPEGTSPLLHHRPQRQVWHLTYRSLPGSQPWNRRWNRQQLKPHHRTFRSYCGCLRGRSQPSHANRTFSLPLPPKNFC